MYTCKVCGDPIDHTIEGELICEKCWTQEPQEETDLWKEVDAYLNSKENAEHTTEHTTKHIADCCFFCAGPVTPHDVSAQSSMGTVRACATCIKLVFQELVDELDEAFADAKGH